MVLRKSLAVIWTVGASLAYFSLSRLDAIAIRLEPELLIKDIGRWIQRVPLWQVLPQISEHASRFPKDAQELKMLSIAFWACV